MQRGGQRRGWAKEEKERVTRLAFGGSWPSGHVLVAPPKEQRRPRRLSEMPSPRPLNRAAFSSQQNLDPIWFHLLTFGEKTQVSGEESTYLESHSQL